MSSDDEIKKNLIKEYMAKMPNTLNTKKEIDEYYKAGWREIKEKIKEDKEKIKKDKEKIKEDKKKEGPKKRINKVKLDEDGNEIEVVKKPLNAYNKYVKEQRPKVQNDFPDLSKKEIFSKISEMWKKHKEDIKNVNSKKDKEEEEEESS